MSNFDKNYIFKIAESRYQRIIMNFIKENWDSNHILGNQNNFFEYEHRQGDNLNFVIAINRSTNQIEALQGFIPYTEKIKEGHVCGVMSCVSRESRMPLLGIETMKRMVSLTEPSSYCGIGTNPKTMLPLVKRVMKRHVGKMEHFYKINEYSLEFNIARIFTRITSRNKKLRCKNKRILFSEVHKYNAVEKSLDLSKTYEFRPFKDYWYIRKRYFDHPIYTYRFFLVRGEESSSSSLLIGRNISLNGSKILRFVDFIGDLALLSSIGQNTDRLLHEEDLEYIDFLCAGVDRKILKNSGFIFKSDRDKNIIPNYFEPFVRENVDIFYETSFKNMILFKADADQDRPSFF